MAIVYSYILIAIVFSFPNFWLKIPAFDLAAFLCLRQRLEAAKGRKTALQRRGQELQRPEPQAAWECGKNIWDTDGYPQKYDGL